MDDMEYIWQDAWERMAESASIRAEVRRDRDYSGEYVSYLVVIVDEKSMPYLHIPESMPDDALTRIMAKLNA